VRVSGPQPFERPVQLPLHVVGLGHGCVTCHVAQRARHHFDEQWVPGRAQRLAQSVGEPDHLLVCEWSVGRVGHVDDWG